MRRGVRLVVPLVSSRVSRSRLVVSGGGAWVLVAYPAGTGMLCGWKGRK